MKTVAFIFFSLLLLKLLAIALVILWLAQIKGYTFNDIKGIIKIKWSTIKSRINNAISIQQVDDELA